MCKVEGCTKPLRAKGYCNSHYIRLRTTGTTDGRGIDKGLTIAWLNNNKNYSGDECLIWPFSKNNMGYGRLSIYYGENLAHRMMCRLAYGAPPSKKHRAAHSCGKGHLGCCNPKHLRWATDTENAADKKLVGTENVGTRNGRSVLSEEKVLEIVSLRQGKMSLAEISAKTGVPIPTISSIVTGANWSSLTGIKKAA